KRVRERRRRRASWRGAGHDTEPIALQRGTGPKLPDKVVETRSNRFASRISQDAAGHQCRHEPRVVPLKLLHVLPACLEIDGDRLADDVQPRQRCWVGPRFSPTLRPSQFVVDNARTTVRRLEWCDPIKPPADEPNERMSTRCMSPKGEVEAPR